MNDKVEYEALAYLSYISREEGINGDALSKFASLEAKSYTGSVYF